MQALCHHDTAGGDLQVPLMELAVESGANPATLAYARSLCEHYTLTSKDVDKRIQGVLDNWDLKRVGDPARNIIRVATVELLMKKIPPKVAVDEGINVAREYGDEESAKFVNGVLDPLLKQIQEES